MSKIKPLIGLSLLDIAFLNEKGLYDGFELQELIKRHGTLERNLLLHIKLLNEIPEMHKDSKVSGLKSDRPFQLLINKIKEIENRIDRFISLMLETEVELPQSIKKYVRLSDLVENNVEIKTVKSFKDIPDVVPSKIEDSKDALWAIADDLRERKKSGEFQSYRDAYRWGANNMTQNNKPIKWKSLENAYDKAKAGGKV